MVLNCPKTGFSEREILAASKGKTETLANWNDLLMSRTMHSATTIFCHILAAWLLARQGMHRLALGSSKWPLAAINVA